MSNQKMKIIKATNYQVEIGSILESSFSNVLKAFSAHKIIIIVDENTHDNCLDYLITSFNELERAEIVLLPTGETNKVMEVCFQVWQALTEYNVSRKDLIINLGFRYGWIYCFSLQTRIKIYKCSNFTSWNG
jgi:3-dehydroquinate synthase